MSNAQFMRLALSLHTRTVVGLIDAVERADTPAQKAERLALVRDAVLEFKAEFMPHISMV